MRETCKIELIVERNLEWGFGRQGSIFLHFIDPFRSFLIVMLYCLSLFVAAILVYHEPHMFRKILSPKSNLKGVQRPAAFAIVCFYFLNFAQSVFWKLCIASRRLRAKHSGIYAPFKFPYVKLRQGMSLSASELSC